MSKLSANADMLRSGWPSIIRTIRQLHSSATTAGKQMSVKNVRRSDIRDLLVLLILVVIVFGWAGWAKRAPIIFSDEAGTLGNARWLAGGPIWHMGAASVSNTGYPILISPIFALVESPALIYRLVIAFNVFLVALMTLVLYVIARRCARVGHNSALAAAACGVAYPAVGVQVGVAWAEIVSMLAVAVLVLTALGAIRRLSPMALAAHGATAGCMSDLHGRFVAIPFLAIVGLITIAFVRPRVRWWAVGSALLTLALTLGFHKLQSAVQVARWINAGTPDTSLNKLLGVIPGAEIRSFAGQVWYLVAGTGGLILLGAFVMSSIARQPDISLVDAVDARPVSSSMNRPSYAAPSSRELSYSDLAVTSPHRSAGMGGSSAAIYVGLMMVSIIMISVTSTAIGLKYTPNGQRADFLYYGRYNECLVPTLICLAVAALLQPAWRRRSVTVICAAAALAPLLLVTSFVSRGYLPFHGSINQYMLSALDPALSLSGPTSANDPFFVVPAAFLASILTLVLAGLVFLKRWLAPLMVIAVFATVTVLDLHQLSPTTNHARAQIPAYEKLRSLSPKVVAYDPQTVGIAMYSMPFWLNDTQFVAFRSADAIWPDAEMFIGPISWPVAPSHGLKKIYVDPMSSRAFWVPQG